MPRAGGKVNGSGKPGVPEVGTLYGNRVSAPGGDERQQGLLWSDGQ